MSGSAETMDWRGLVLTALAAALLTALIAMPVVRAPTAQLFGHELVGRHHDPFTVIEQYAAGGAPAYLQPATDLPGMALAQIIAPAAAYNLMVLSTFVLAAMFAYAHAYYVIGSRTGAVVAALLFAFSPFHIAQAAYHVHIAQIQWIPLFFLCLWRLLERPSALRAVATGVALLVTAAASLYLGFVTAVIAPVGVAVYIGARPRTSRPALAAMWSMVTLIATAAIACGAIAFWAPDALLNPDAFAFPASAIDQHSARWWSYVIPSAAHPLLGQRSVAFMQSRGVQEGLLEQQLSLGLSVIGLAMVPLLRRPAQGTETHACPAAALVATAVAAGLCSLPAVASVLHPIAPMFRAYARFAVIVSLMISTLAGAGVARLLQRAGRGRTALASALIAAALFEYVPQMPAARDTLPTSAHRWLADVKGLRVLDCTTPTPGSTAGVVSLMASEVMFPAGPLADCAEPNFAAKLAVFDFTHLLVRHDGASASWIIGGGGPDGTPVLRSFSDATVFAVTASKPSVYVGELPGFYPREFRDSGAWRWMPREGAITIINTRSAPSRVWLDLELDAFDRERVVHAAGPGANALTILKVTPATAWQTLGPFELTAGENTVSLVADAASSAHDVSGLPDARPLSIRLRRWAIRHVPPLGH